jgi:signal peptidase I
MPEALAAAPAPTSDVVPVVASPAPQPAAEPDQTSNGDGVGSLLWTIFKGIINWVLIPVLIVFVLHTFVFQAFHVVGSSMVPTLHESDYLIISKLGATSAKITKGLGRNTVYTPKRGEVIVFHYPKDPSLVFVKRVIGLPGDHVVVKDGQVTIYNAASPSGFDPDAGLTLNAPTTLGSFDDTVPAGSVFVLGDNRAPNGSYDSREWGYLDSSYIIGNAVIRLLPVSTARFLVIPDMSHVARELYALHN